MPRSKVHLNPRLWLYSLWVGVGGGGEERGGRGGGYGCGCGSGSGSSADGAAPREGLWQACGRAAGGGSGQRQWRQQQQQQQGRQAGRHPPLLVDDAEGDVLVGRPGMEPQDAGGAVGGGGVHVHAGRKEERRRGGDVSVWGGRCRGNVGGV